MQHYYDNVTLPNGYVVPGASVLVQSNGVAAALYSDNGVTPKANPLTTDATGSFDFYAANGTYTVVVTPRAGSATQAYATLFDVNDVNATAIGFSQLAASTGSSLIGFKQSGTGAVARTAQDKGRETVSVKDFGAVLDGAADDTAAFTLAIAALPAAGGTIVVPPGIPTLNLVLLKSGIRIVGCSKTSDRGITSNYWQPFDNTKPAVQIANDTGIVSGCTLEQITFNGSGTKAYGLLLAGGCYRNSYLNVSAQDFTGYNIKGLSGANPVAYNWLTNGHINASVAGSTGLFMGVGTGGSYCEANGLVNYNISGPSTSGWCIENDSSGSLYLTNVWIQAQNNCGVKFTKSFAVVPKIRCANVDIDSDVSTDALITTYDTVVAAVSDLMHGSLALDGKLKQSDGTLVPTRGYGAWLPFQSNLSYPYVYGSLKFLNGTSAAAMDYTASVPTIACSSSNWDFTNPVGATRLLSSTSAGVYLGSTGVYRWQVTDASLRPQTDVAYDLGTASLRIRDTYTQTVRSVPLTVATLPAVSAGIKAFVTDATATTFASIVVGGGANGVPVYSDGTNWRIG